MKISHKEFEVWALYYTVLGMILMFVLIVFGVTFNNTFINNPPTQMDEEQRKEDVYWNDSVAVGDAHNTTTYIRITPQLRDFYMKVKAGHEIAGVIFEENSLNLGFILKEKKDE